LRAFNTPDNFYQNEITSLSSDYELRDYSRYKKTKNFDLEKYIVSG